MISDVPFGTFLSGGTDSSLITAIASQHVNKLNTFSIGFKESKYNEAKYAKEISAFLKTNHHELMVSEKDAVSMVGEILDTYDEPFADSSAIPTMIVAKFARQNVKMTLSGDGGDELFFGYGAYHWAERLAHPAVNTFKKPMAFALSKLGMREKRASHLFRYTNKQKIKSHIFSQEQYFFSCEETISLLNPDNYEELNLEEDYSSLKRKLSPKEEQALFDMKYYLKDDLLVKVDRATMKYGLETRVPFLDYRIVEFALNLSPELKSKNGTDKFLLKEILYDFIPKKYFNRPKWGFAIPLKEWLKKELAFLLEETLNKTSVEQAGIVRFDVVHKLKKKFINGEDYLYNRLWSLIVLHKFLAKTI